MLHKETIVFTWETAEFKFKEKRKDWYWIVGIIAAVLIILAIILNNYLFAFIIGIGAFLMISMASKEPLSIPIEISDHGIQVGDEMHNYNSLHQFWIAEDEDGIPVLLLLSNSNNISPIISLKIGEGINPMDVREYLLNFIDEEEMKGSITDRIIEKIGF